MVTTRASSRISSPSPGETIISKMQLPGFTTNHRVLRHRHVRNTEDDNPLVCCVCLNNIAIVSVSTFCSLIQCRQCNNIFHERCFRKFMNVSEHPSCPLCKKEVEDLNSGWEINSNVVETFYESDDESYVFSDNMTINSIIYCPTRNLRSCVCEYDDNSSCHSYTSSYPHMSGRNYSLRRRNFNPQRRMITRAIAAYMEPTNEALTNEALTNHLANEALAIPS